MASLNSCEGTFAVICVSSYQLPEPQTFMTAKSYKAKFAEPLIKKLKEMIKSLIVQCAKIWDSYHRINERNGRLYKENEHLIASNDRLKEENSALREQTKEYSLLRKVFGSKQIDDLVAQAREAQQAKRRQRQRSYDYER